MNKESKFKELLKGIFQFNRDSVELDFGVYRVFKRKQEEIRKFIEEKLSEIAETALEKLYREHSQQLGGISREALREKAYNHILNFFSRFYEGGDFYPRREFFMKENQKAPYALDYRGEEVFFWWATKGQHYIKSVRLFSEYPMEVKGKMVVLKVVEVEELKGNQKDKRRFYLTGKLSEEGGRVVVELEYKEKGEKELTEENLAELLKEYLPDVIPEELEYHVRRFTSLRERDFFIHPELGKFLKRELEYYLKNEIISLDNPVSLYEAFITKEIALKVIDFLSNMEKLQQTLWEKKKFTYNVNYVITLDRFKNVELVREIEQHGSFNKQEEEWKELRLIEDLPPLYETLKRIQQLKGLEVKREWLTENQQKKWQELFGGENTLELFHILEKDPAFLKKIASRIEKRLSSAPLFGENGISIANILENYLKIKHLPIDTKYFSDLKYRILEQFEDLEKELDGLLIKSDNWQALNTILPKYKEKVQTIYIDPPFNKEQEADYLYRVGYKDATWITMLEDRLKLARELLNEKGSIFVRCDYNGNMYVRLLLNEIFGEENFRNEIVVSRTKKIFSGVKGFNVASDTVLFFSKTDKFTFNSIYKEREKQKWLNMHSPGERKPPERIILGRVFYPPKERHWTFVQEKIYELEKQGRIRINEDIEYEDILGNKVKGMPQYLTSEKELLDSNWTDISGYSQTWKFQTENSEILLKRVIESTSNEGDLVLDFFLGSGTTTAVVHKLGRKWMGVEMGDHFEDIILPRMKKVLYYDSSGISRDVKEHYNEYRAGGTFKYLYLEQYEDTLENVDFVNDYLGDRSKELERAKELYPDFAEGELLKLLRNFVLDNTKTLLTTERVITRPFDFTVRLSEGEEVKVDLAETFCILKPMEVKRLFMREKEGRRYLFVEGESIALVLREVGGSENYREEEKFIKEHLPQIEHMREVFINAVLEYPKEFLGGKAKELTTELRKLLLQGVKSYGED